MPRGGPSARPRLRTVVAPRAAIGFGLCAGLLGAVLDVSPAGRAIERTLTRERLIEARGTRPAPAGVTVVSMDEERPDRRAVARSDRRWSRHVYASLIERLTALGASVVVLDVAFEDAGDEAGDAALEAALSRGVDTVLFRRLERTPIGDASVPTLPRFASAARAQGVFPLPKTPDRVEYFWPFFRLLEPTGADGERTLEEMPSLPVAALQLAVLREVGVDRFEGLLGALRSAEASAGTVPFRSSGSVTRAMSALRRELMADVARRGANDVVEDLPAEVSPAALARLRALLRVYSARDTLLLNFYGPTRTVETLEHGTILDAREDASAAVRDAVGGRVVFVGHSGRSAVDQRDAYRTVYTRADGVDISGVEIAATAYANLVDGSTFRTLPPWAGASIHGLFGVTVALIALCAGTWRAVTLGAALAALYFAAAVRLADGAYLLLPVGVPLLVLLPAILFAGLFHRHLGARRQRDRYQDGTARMLPRRAVDAIEAGRTDRRGSERLYGTCMITDVEGYATVCESVAAERLADLSREYFSILARRTRLAGGELIDLEGDSMTAVWASAEPTAETQGLATGAAVAIVRALDEFDRRHPDTPFRTRIGLHAGWMAAANIGGGNTYRHRVVGDVVNTAARLETLNKRLGTSVLASRAVIADTTALIVRPLGTFVPKGKSEPLEIVEVMGLAADATPSQRELCRRFEGALRSLANRCPEAALGQLVESMRLFGTDGPSRFYVELLLGHGPPDARIDARGVVTLDGA